MNRAILLAGTAAVGLLAVAGTARAQLVPAAEPQVRQASMPAPVQRAPAQPTPAAPASASGNPQGGDKPLYVPDGPPPALPLVSGSTPLRPREQRNVAAATRWRGRACSPTRRPDGVLAFRTGDCEVTVVCAPFRACDVALMPGEMPTGTPAVGDPRIGLQQAPRFTGEGQERTLHMVFIPSDAGIQSSVVLHTNKRLVNLLVVTTQRSYMPAVALDEGTSGSGAYSGWAALAALGAAGGTRDPCDAKPIIPPSQFTSSNSGWLSRTPAWKPLQTYGVALPSGQPATCVQFPADIETMDPPLLIPRDLAGGAEGAENVVVTGRYYRVNRTVSAFDLVSGIGGAQERVKIRRKN